MWNLHKETFNQYAIDKLVLMHRLELPVKNTIHLLVGGIRLILQNTLRITALSVKADNVESFLDQMRTIAEGFAELERRAPTNFGKPAKPREDLCRNCGKRGHIHKNCRDAPMC